MKRRGLYLLFATLSVFAVLVSAISTFAWFQVNQRPLETDITTASSDIAVKRIKGYKFEYDEPEKGAVNYTSGEITSVTTYDNIGDSDVTDEMEAIKFDIPEDGTGYYVMGDSNWVAAYNAEYDETLDTSDYAYKFKASVKLKKRSLSTTIYCFSGFTTTADNTYIRVKRHYFVGQDTTNSYINVSSGSDYTSSLADFSTVDGVKTVKIKKAGTYNFYLNTSGSLFSVEKALDVTKENTVAPAQSPGNKVIRKEAGDSVVNVILVSLSKNDYAKDSCYVFVRLYGGINTTGYPGLCVNYGHKGADGSYLLDVSAYAGFTEVEFSRWNGNNGGVTGIGPYSGWSDGSGGGWNKHKYTGLTANNQNKFTPTISSGVSMSKESESYNSYLNGTYSSGYYLMGNGLNGSTSWSMATAIKQDASTDDGTSNEASWKNDHTITFSTSPTGFKMVLLENNTSHGALFYYNNSISGAGFSGGNGSDISCTTAGTYHVFYSKNGTIYFAQALPVRIFTVAGGNTSQGDTQYATKGAAFYPIEPAITNYAFSEWRSGSASGSVWTSGSVVNSAFDLYGIYNRSAVVYTLTPSFFLSSNDGGAQLDISLEDVTYANGSIVTTKTQEVAYGTGFGTQQTFADCQYYDSTNCIWYVFRKADANWYSSSACTGNNYTAAAEDDTPVYAKMVADQLLTVYADIKSVHSTWSSCSFAVFGVSGFSKFTNANPGSAKCLMNSTLYRITIPNTCTHFLFQNGSHYGGNDNNCNQTVDISYKVNNGYYRFVGNGQNNYANYNMDSDASEPGGTLFIVRTKDSSVESYRMGYSDTTNLAVLETGVILNKGDQFCVHYVVSENNQWHDACIAYTYADSTVATSAVNIDGSTRAVRTITKTGRYTFYFNNSHNIAVAQVPLEGNGYYIMTSSTNQCDTFDNSHRMKTISDNASTNRAFLKNLYIKESCYVYMRSYNDNVDLGPGNGNDTRYTGRIGESGTLERTVHIVISSPGYYNVYAYYSSSTHVEDNLRFSIVATDERDTFFTLNSISVHGEAVKNQNTTLIMEVAFTSVSVEPSSISVIVNNSFTNVGSFAICRDKKLKDPYTALRKAVYEGGFDENEDRDYTDAYDIASSSLSTGNQTFNSLCSTTANDGEKLYYAYIMFDYMSIVNGASPNGSFSFYIKSSQIVS